MGDGGWGIGAPRPRRLKISLDILGNFSYHVPMDDHSNPTGEGDLPAPPLHPAVQPAPSPALLAKRLEQSLHRKRDIPLTPEQRLEAQGILLDSLFSAMLFSTPHPGQDYDERFNIAVALRAQKQSAHALTAISDIRYREKKRKDDLEK